MAKNKGVIFNYERERLEEILQSVPLKDRDALKALIDRGFTFKGVSDGTEPVFKQTSVDTVKNIKDNEAADIIAKFGRTSKKSPSVDFDINKANNQYMEGTSTFNNFLNVGAYSSQLIDPENIDFIDFEGFGEKGTDSFHSYQFSLSRLKNGKHEKESFLTHIDKSSATYNHLKKIIQKAKEDPEKLTKDERRDLFNLTDIKIDKTGKAVGQHHNYSSLVKIGDNIINKASEGLRIISSAEFLGNGVEKAEKIQQVLGKDKNRKIAAYNGGVYDFPMFKKLGVDIGNRGIDLYHLTQALMPLLSLGKPGQDYIKEILVNGHLENYTLEELMKKTGIADYMKVNGGTQHEADFDAEGMARVYEKFYETIPESAYANLFARNSVLKKGSVSVAKRSSFRKTTTDFKASPTGKKSSPYEIKNKEGEEFNGLMFADGGVYQYVDTVITNPKNNDGLLTQKWVNLETGETTYLTDTKEGLQNTVSSIFGNKFGTRSEHEGDLKEKAIGTALNTVYELEAQLELLKNPNSKKFSEEQRKRHAIVKDYIKANQERLTHAISLIRENTDLLSVKGYRPEANLLLKTILGINNVTTAIENPSHVGKIIKSMPGQTANQIKKNYEKFIMNSKDLGETDRESLLEILKGMRFTDLETAGKNSFYAMNSAIYNAIEERRITLKKPRRFVDEKTGNYIGIQSTSEIEQKFKENKEYFAKGTKGSVQARLFTLYKALEVINPSAAKALSGKYFNEFTENLNLKRSKSGKQIRKAEGFSGSSFVKGTAGWYLEQIILASEKQKMGVHIRPSVDGTSLELSFYDAKNIKGANVTDDNGNLTLDKNHTATFNVPLVNSEGVITYNNGMRRMNNIHPVYSKISRYAAPTPMSLKYTTLNEDMWENVLKMVSQEKLPEGWSGETFADYLIKLGDVAQATSLGKNIVRKALESTPSGGSYNVAQEVESQTKDGANAEQRLLRGGMIPLRSLLENIYSTFYYDAEDEQMQTMSNEQMMNMMKYITLRQRGAQDSILKTKDELGNTINNVELDFIKRNENGVGIIDYLDDLASKLPYLSYEDLKEESFTSGYVSAIGSRIIEAFGDLNDMSTRHLGQGDNYITRSKKAVDLLKKFKTEKGNFLKSQGKAYALYEDPFVSGHLTSYMENSLAQEKNQRLLYNVGYINDTMIKQRIDEAIANPDKFGLSQGQVEELKGLNLPSVYEGGHIMPEKLMATFEGYRTNFHAMSKDSEWTSEFLELLQNNGIDETLLDQMKDGDYLPFADKDTQGIKLDKNLLLGKPPKKTKGFEAAEGSIIHGIKYENGVYKINMTDFLETHQGSKNVGASGLRVTTNSVADWVFDIMAGGNKNIDILTEIPGLATKNFKQIVGDRYTYLINLARGAGISDDIIQKAIEKTQVFKNYTGYNQDKKKWETFAEISEKGQWVDKSGNLLLPDENATRAFVSTDMDVLIKELGLEQYDENIYRDYVSQTALNRMNEYPYYTATGLLDPNEAAAKGGVKVDEKLFQGFEKQIRFAEESTGEKFDLVHKAWNHMVNKVAGASDERKEAFKIQKKYVKALGENDRRIFGEEIDDSNALKVIFDNEMQERELSDNSVLLSDLLTQKNAGEMSNEGTTYDNLLALARDKGLSKIVFDLGEGRQIEYGTSGEFLSQITAPLIDFNYVGGEKVAGEYIQKVNKFLNLAAERDNDGNYKDLTKSANELLSQMANSAFHKNEADFKKRGSRYVSMASVSPSFTANVGDMFLKKLGGGAQNQSIANFVNAGNRVLMSPEKLRAMIGGDSIDALWTRQLIHMDLTGEMEKSLTTEEQNLRLLGVKDTKGLIDAFIQGKLDTDPKKNEEKFKNFLSAKSQNSSKERLDNLLGGYDRWLRGDKKGISEKKLKNIIQSNFEYSGGMSQQDWIEQIFKDFNIEKTITDENGVVQQLKRDERMDLLWSKGVHKTTGQSFREYNSTLIDTIVDMVTVENFIGNNTGQTPRGIAALLMRYPEITGIDGMLIDFYVSNQLKGELAPYVASIGLAEFMNADQDGDKLNGFMLFYNSIKNSSMAGKTLQQFNKIKEMTATATKIRSVARIRGANEDAKDQTGNLEWSDEAVAKFHKELNPITNLQIATISKANKEYVGYLSNISTTMRKVMDLAHSELHDRWEKGDISRGQLLENQYENLLLGGFFEMYEQDSISAKKVIERALKNPDFDYASESKALYELTNLLKSFDVKKDSTRTAKWSQIIKKSEELGFFKTDEAGNVIMKNRQFLNALARISSSYQQVMKTTTDEAEKTSIKEYLRSEDVGLGWLIGEKDGEDGVAQKMLATIGEDEFGNVRNIDDDILAQFEKEGIAIRPNQVIKVFENMEKTLSAMTGGLSLTQLAQKLRYVPQLGMSKTTEKNLAKNIGKYENVEDLIKWEDLTKAIQLDSEIVAYAVELDDKNNAHDYLHSEFDPRYVGKDKESRKIKTGAGTKTYSITQLGDLIFNSKSRVQEDLKEFEEHFKKIGQTIFNVGGKDIDYDTLVHQAAVNQNAEAQKVLRNAISSKYLDLAGNWERSGDKERWGALYWSQVSSREGTLKHKAFELAEKLQKEKKITSTNGEWFNSLFKDSEGNVTSEYTELENLIKTSNHIIEALGFSQKFSMEDISKIVNTYMNTKSSLGLGDATLTEFSMGATFKIGDETVDILGTMDALLTEGQDGFTITDFKNKNEGHPEVETWQLTKLRQLLIKTLEDSMLTQEEVNRMQSNDFTNLDEKQQDNLKRKIGLYKKLEEAGIVDDKQKSLMISDLINQQRMQILQFMKPGGKANKSSYYKMARRLFGITDGQTETTAVKLALNETYVPNDIKIALSSEDPYSIRTFNEMGEDISYDTYNVHNKHMYYYDDNGELKILKHGQSNFEQILEAFTLSDTILKKSKEKLKLKERLAFLGEDGTLVGNTFVGQQKKINLAQVQDGLIEQFGEMANVPKLKGVIHTHTNGSSVFSLEDIQSFKENELFKDTDLFYLFNGKELVTMNLEGLDEKQRKDFFEEYEQAYQDKKEEILKSEDFKQFLDRRKQKMSVDESVDETKIATEIESEIFEDFLAEDDNVFNIETLFPANSASNNRIGRHKLKEIANQANRAYDLAQLANKNFVQGSIMGAQFMGQQTPAIIDKSIESTKSDIVNFDNLVAEQVEKIQPNDTSIKTIGEFFNKLDIPNLKKVAESFSELSNIEPINSDTTLKTKEDILSHLTNIGAETKNIKAEDLTEELRTELTEKASMTEAYKRLQNKEGYFDKSGRFVDKPLLENELKELENNQEQASKLLDKHKAKNNMRDVWKNIKDLDAKGELTETEALTREYLENLYNDMIKGYAAGIGVDVENKGDVNTVKKDLEKQFKSQENINTEETNKATKTAISDLQTLQQMLSQNAPNQFTKSITGDLGDMLSKLDEGKRSFKDLAEQLTTEQKVQIQQGILNSVDQSLGTIRSADQGIMQMEDQMKHASPLQRKLMQGKINQLNLQKAGAQADIDRQLQMTDGTDLNQQIQDRQELTRVMTEQTKAYEKEHGAIDKNMAKMSQFGQSVKGMLATSFQYGVVYRGAQSVIQQIYTIIGSIQEFDALMTQLRMINGAGEDITANMIAGYKELGDEMGLTTQEVTATAVTFLRQGRSIADTNELMRQSAILAKTAFMDQNQAAELLTSTLNGFQLEAKDAAEVIDLVAYTDTMTATSADELMTAFQYVASSADTAGIEVEKLNAMIATSSEATRLSAQMIGTAYKTIISRLQQVKVGSLVDAETGEDISNVDKMLKQYGLTVMDVNGKMKDGDQILSEFAELWNSWGNDTAKKREAVEALAGTRQGNIAMSLFENWDRYEEILKETEENAAGSASKKMDVAKESIQTSLAQLQNALRQFGDSEWAGDLFKWVVDLTTGFVNLAPVILGAVVVFRLMKTQGGDLVTMYQLQSNALEKLRMSILSVTNAEKAHQMQAQQMIANSQMQTFTQGSRTAFFDPKTGQFTEQMDNSTAASKMALYNENTYRNAMIKAGDSTLEAAGISIEEDAIGVRTYGFKDNSNALTGLYKGALSGKAGDVNLATQRVQNLEKVLNHQVVAKNITDADKSTILRYGNYVMNSGNFTDEQINTQLKGLTNLTNTNGLSKELLDDMKNKTGDYEYNYTSEEQEQIDLIRSFNVEIDKAIKSLQNFSGEVDKASNTQQQENQAELEGVSTQQQENQAELEGTAVTLEKKNAELIDTAAEKADAEAEYLGAKANLTKGQMIGGSFGGLVGMMGSSMGITAVGSALGMSAQTSSVLGMTGGMGISMLSMIPGWGPFVSAGIGALGMIASYAINTEKERHEEVMNNIKEASDAYKNHQSKLKEVDDQEFKNEFERLSQGVDENGQNVSLSTEEYENYQAAVEKLTDGHGELIKGYNEEGQAIINRDTLLEKSIALTKEQMRLEKQRMYDKEKLREQQKDIDEREDTIWENRFNSVSDKDKWTDLRDLLSDSTKTSVIKSALRTVVSDAEYTTDEMVAEAFIDKDKYEKMKKQIETALTAAENGKMYGAREDIEEALYDLEKYREEYISAQNIWKQEAVAFNNERKTQWKGYAESHLGQKWSDDQIALMGELIDNLSNEQLKDMSEDSETYNVLEKYADLINNSETFGAIKKAISNTDNLTLKEISSNVSSAKRIIIKSGFFRDNPYNIDQNDFYKQLGFDEAVSAETEFKNKLAKDFGVTLNRAGNVKIKKNQTEEEKKKIETYNDFVDSLDNITLSTLKNLNTNYEKLMVDDVVQAFSEGSLTAIEAIEKIYDKIKDLEYLSFGDRVNLDWQTNTTDGLTNLMSLIKNYRENDKLMSPEILKGLKEIESNFHLTAIEIDKALSDGNGGWALNANNVQMLMATMIRSALEDNSNYSLEDLVMFSQNANHLGIKNVEQLGYGEAILKFIDKGLLTIEGGQLTESAGLMSAENKSLYDAAKTSAAYKNNVKLYEDYARSVKIERFLDLNNLKTILEGTGNKNELYKDSVTEEMLFEFSDGLETAINNIGSFSEALNKFSAVDIVNDKTAMSFLETGDIEGFATRAKFLTDDDFGGATDIGIAAMGIAYLNNEKERLAIQQELLSSVEFEESALAGMLAKEHEEAKRSAEDLQQKLDDLNKEARLSKLKLDIDLVQVGFDKLNKTISTLASSLDLLDEGDSSGRLNLLTQQLQAVDELSIDLNAEWNRLNEALNTAETGEEAQAIVEQMSAISDSMTDSATKQIQLEKEMNTVLANGFTERISNMKTIVDRELKLLEAQKKRYSSNEFIFYNPNAVSVFGTLKRDKSELDKKRSETQKIIDEEKKRQETIAEIRKNSLEAIYEDEKKRRDRELDRADKDLKEALKKIEETTVESFRDSIQKTLDEIERIINKFNEADHKAIIKAELRTYALDTKNTKFGDAYEATNKNDKNFEKTVRFFAQEKLQNSNSSDLYAFDEIQKQLYENKGAEYKVVNSDANRKTNFLRQFSTGQDENGAYILPNWLSEYKGTHTDRVFTRKDLASSGELVDGEFYKLENDDALVEEFKNFSGNTNLLINRYLVNGETGQVVGQIVAASDGTKKVEKYAGQSEEEMLDIGEYKKSKYLLVTKKNDLGTPYGNDLATSIINKTNTKVAKIAGEKADEWLFHNDGSIERLDYKQGGTIIPSDTEVAGSRYTNQLDNVLLKDRGTVSGNKTAALFGTKKDYTKIFEESLEDISKEVDDKTSKSKSGNSDNIYGIIKKANESISEEEKKNKEDIQKIVKITNANIEKDEKETKQKIYNKNSIMNDNIIKNTEEFSTKFQNAFIDLMDNMINYTESLNMVEEAKKYIGQNNADGKFSNGRIEEWCADFISTLAEQAGIPNNQLPRSSSVSGFYNFFKEKGSLTSTPTIGNLAMKGKNKHIGIVASVDGDKVVLIEGNTGNKDDRKSVVSQNTYSLSKMLENGWEFGVYDNGIGIMNNKDLSHYGIMSEKQGEYKVDKRTGEWIYEPYETVVDTNKYDVISSKESQKIRSRQYDGGTIGVDEKEIEKAVENGVEKAFATHPILGKITVEIKDGKTQTADLPVGTIIHTNGGDYEITGGNAGNYTSNKVPTNIQEKVARILEESENDIYYYSEDFMEYLKESNRKESEFLAYSYKLSQDDEVSFNQYASTVRKYSDEQIETANKKSLSETSKAMSNAMNAMSSINEAIREAELAGEDTTPLLMQLAEAHDNYQDTLEQLNENISKIAEEMKEKLMDDLTQSLSHASSAIVEFTKDLSELSHVASLMFDTQHQLRIANQMASIATLTEQREASIDKLKTMEDANEEFTDKIRDGVNTLSSGFWKDKDMEDALANVFNADGTINEKANANFIQTLKGLYNINMLPEEELLTLINSSDKVKKAMIAEDLSAKYNIDSEKLMAYVETIANFDAMKETAPQIYETEQEINRQEEERFNQLKAIIDLQKEALMTEKEERFSILQAVNKNNQLISEWISIEEKLIREPNITDKASNMRDQYNQTIATIESQEELTTTLKGELNNLINKFDAMQVSYRNEEGDRESVSITPEDWMGANGEIISAIFNRDLNALQLAADQAIQRGNERLAQKYISAIASMETIAQMQGDYTNAINELGHNLADAVNQLDEIAKQQAEWMKQYITSLVSGMQYNIANNEMLKSYISTTGDSYGQFDRDNKQLSNNAEIGVLQANVNNLLAKFETLKKETSDIKQDVFDITGVDLGTLFSADGERHAYNYTKFTRELEENLRQGVITNNEYTEILAKLDTYEETVKQEVQTQDDIIKNYQEINSAIEEQIKLAIESYDWQIKKQETLLSLKEKEFETQNKIYRLRLDLDKEIRSAKQSTQWLTESERRKIFNEESYTRLYNSLEDMENKTAIYAEEYYDQIMGLTEDTLYQQEFITSEYERRLALVEMEYNITKQRVDLEKKQMELANVLAEKNSRVYINGEWRQVANTEDVKNTSEEVADIEAELKLAEEERKQKIQSNQMQDFIDSLKQNQAALENTMNYTSDTNKELIDKLSDFIGSIVGEDLGGDSLNQKVRNVVKTIDNLDQSLDVLIDKTIKSAIDTLGTLNTSLEEKIQDYINEVDRLENTTEKQNSRLEQVNSDLYETNSELCNYLDDLADTIKDTIKKISSYAKEDEEEYDEFESELGDLSDKELLNKMQQNMENWHGASESKQDDLEAENQWIAERLGLTFKDGKWYDKNGNEALDYSTVGKSKSTGTTGTTGKNSGPLSGVDLESMSPDEQKAAMDAAIDSVFGSSSVKPDYNVPVPSNTGSTSNNKSNSSGKTSSTSSKSSTTNSSTSGWSTGTTVPSGATVVGSETRNGTVGYVWVMKKATGDRFTTDPIYNVDEIGKELIISPVTSGRYAAMEYGSQIVPHNLSENILKWGAINPASINANKPEFTSNLTNNAITYSIGTIKLDNVTNGENFIPELNRFLQRTTTLNNR